MWETFTPEDQGFLINVNRIRVSRDLSTTRKGAATDIRLIFLNCIIGRRRDEKVILLRCRRYGTLKSVVILMIGKSVIDDELESRKRLRPIRSR